MTNHAIRPATAADAGTLLSICDASGLMGPEEMDYMRGEVGAWAAGAGDAVWLMDDGGAGAALLHPEPMSDAVWNMLFVGVRMAARRTGVATALLDAVEAAARSGGGRILLIDTAGADDFAPARALYAKRGYEREAVIRGYYGDGVDRVTFRRDL
ncbi:GNAT family N-acetyltransferase [Jannaschia sp. LMIT008]|uniref:GNAT family N-acetyltransferase n=1 Tax=Jannaschia maritima TaxID=3032585 RepID=UPI002811D6C7|nr:GNAT family N-acetyltransferase [Jannaschia sp. LMIT008]